MKIKKIVVSAVLVAMSLVMVGCSEASKVNSNLSKRITLSVSGVSRCTTHARIR